MGLLGRKPKIGIEEFCQQFYDSQVFHATIDGEDIASGFWEIVCESVAEVDSSFAGIALAAFEREMTALRIELFGLAWMHHLQLDDYLVAEIVFTKSYLERNGQLEIWAIMSDSNRVIARAMELPSREPVRRDFMPLASEEVIREGHIGSIRNLRADLSGKW